MSGTRKDYRVSVRANVYSGPRGVFVWTAEELHFFAVEGNEDEVETWADSFERITSIPDFIEYAIETQLGGMNTFSFPEDVRAASAFDAAQSLAGRNDFRVVNNEAARFEVPAEAQAPVVVRDYARDYVAYRETLAVLSNVLRATNSAEPGSYADVRAAGEWIQNEPFATLFTAPNGAQEAALAFAWDGYQLVMQNPDGRRSASFDGPQRLSTNEGVEVAVREVLSAAGLDGTGERSADHPERFGVWAEIFALAVALLDEFDRHHAAHAPWTLSIGFHSGWGTYYVFFHDNTGTKRIAFSEEGHFAAVDPDFFEPKPISVRELVMTKPFDEARRVVSEVLFSA